MIRIYFFFSMKDGCIQHAHRQIKEVEQLQKLWQSDCQNHIGRRGVLYVQMGPESEICLLMGVKGAWFDETAAENSWLAWLWLHLHMPCKRLALNIYFFCFFSFFFFFPCKPCFSLGDVQHSFTMSSLGHQLPLKPWPARGVLLSCSVRGGFIWGVKRQESCCHSLPLLMLWRVCREANRGTEATFPCSRVMVGEHKTSRMQAVSPHSSRDLNSYWVLCWDVCLCSGNPSYIPWRNLIKWHQALKLKQSHLPAG